ncbi:MAG: hypothetical protein KKA32_04590 [Actinobacteria bacterium]|nr:hypothetical protein [Actinomycetota bacterium]
MKKVLVAGVLVIAMLGLLSAAAFTAPGDPDQTVTVNATVSKAVWLNVTDAMVALAGSPGINAHTDTAAAFEVRANWNWTLQANALANLNGTDPDGGAVVLPASRILVGGSSAEVNRIVASGAKVTSLAVPVTYGANFTWDDTAGTYSGPHTYTLAFQ